MRNRLLLALSFVVAASAIGQTVEPMFVRDAVGLRATAPAPHLADRVGVEPLVTLAAASEAVPEEIEAIREWNAQNHTPMRNGFTRAIGDTLRVRMSGAVASATSNAQRANVWSGSVRIANAYRMRLHLQNVVVPAGTQFWVYGRGETPIAFGTELIDNGELYAPSIGGDTAYLEMEVPSNAAASFDVSDVLELIERAETLALPSRTKTRRSASSTPRASPSARSASSISIAKRSRICNT